MDSSLPYTVLLSISVASSSTTSLSISWLLAGYVTATSSTISYYNTDTDCFNMTYDDITTSETTVELTGLEEGTEYSVTVTATLSDGKAADNNLTASTRTAGKFLLPLMNTHKIIITQLHLLLLTL